MESITMTNYKHHLGSHIALDEGELAVLDKVISLCSDYVEADAVSDRACRQLQDWCESGEEIDAALVQEMIFNLINHLNKISENLRPNGMIWRLNDSNGMEFGLFHNEYQEEV